MAVLTSRPGKALWTLLAVVLNAARFPLWLLYYIPASARPHPKWTYRQAISVRVVRAFLWNAAMVEMKTPLSLVPRSEKERWAVFPVADKAYYVGPTTADPAIKPEQLGATWYAAAPKGRAGVGIVVLHFHGGAYVIGDGRTQDAGYAAKTILKQTDATHVCAPQYRLSSNQGCRFPAALQDAITSYAYLLSTGVQAKQIVLSGDSAGANLALSLTKYLTEHGSTIGLQGPLATWLWSPWVAINRSLTTSSFDNSINKGTDYLSGAFGAWGAREYMPSTSSGLTLDDPYISFLDNAFATPTPIYISTGEAEVLFHDDVQLAEQMAAVKGNNVKLQIEEYCVHDTILTGVLVGFEKEAALAVKRAGEWLRTVNVAQSKL